VFESLAVRLEGRIVAVEPLGPQHVEGLRAAAADDIAVVVGGTIPAADVPRLRAAGAAAVYPTGTPLEDILVGVRQLAMEAPCESA
jgi:methylmalonyl-CoA mutase, C-terminal domain